MTASTSQGRIFQELLPLKARDLWPLPISLTTANIVRDTFSWSLKLKKKEIEQKQPIPDTPSTKFPKLEPTIQSWMTPAAKTADKVLEGYVLDMHS